MNTGQAIESGRHATTARPFPGPPAAPSPLRQEHEALRERIGDLAFAASRLGHVSPSITTMFLDDAIRLVAFHVIPHMAGEHDLTAALVAGAHGVAPGVTPPPEQASVVALTGELETLRRRIGAGAGDATVDALRRVLYGLHAVCSIHFADGDSEPALPMHRGAGDIFSDIERVQREARARGAVRAAWKPASAH